MLNLYKLATFSEQVLDTARKKDEELYLLAKAWGSILTLSDSLLRVSNSAESLALPLWQGPLDQKYSVSTSLHEYQILAIDGSQIYPDRHEGGGWYLINIGSVFLSYGKEKGSARFDSTPEILIVQEEIGAFDAEQVNWQRTEREFRAGLFQSREVPSKEHYLFVCDGSLIFWHLQNAPHELRQRYFASYLSLMQQFFEEQILIAGYISLPKSRELINVVRFLSDSRGEDLQFLYSVDTDLVGLFLHPGERTTIFQNRSSVIAWYPKELQPYFFYLHVGDEIARIEIPAWIAHDEHRVELIAAMLLDQAKKGGGYPISLSEAHEQAVVKGCDRQQFYRLIHTMLLKSGKEHQISLKSMRKRVLGI